MNNKHRSPSSKPSGGNGNPPDPRATPRPDAPVRFYAEAVYVVNRGLPHIMDFPARLS